MIMSAKHWKAAALIHFGSLNTAKPSDHPAALVAIMCQVGNILLKYEMVCEQSCILSCIKINLDFVDQNRSFRAINFGFSPRPRMFIDRMLFIANVRWSDCSKRPSCSEIIKCDF